MRPAGGSLATELADPVADDAPHLVERGRSFETAPEPVFTERRHPLLARRCGELLGRALDRGADASLNGQHLVEGDAAAIPATRALEAPGCAVERLARL